MKFWTRIKQACQRFSKDDAGSRFINLHCQLHARRQGNILKIISIGVGVLLIVAGFLLGLVPGVPGIFLGIAGLGLIAAEFKPLARGCDRAELALRKLFARFRSRWHH